eukprot:TRINITY_DN110842_c0_g1_i1.p1 TRINITY_DN110842_c0_g1~~TRINITY_DN110842_c0_g1_i1.p1  ORF type:complete len:317 (-),score=69.32 TRINITY_DN110842_c0_g1_i1:364-1314(-)
MARSPTAGKHSMEICELEEWEESSEKETEALQKWAQIDIQTLALTTAQGVVQRHPIVVGFWVFGLLIAGFAGGLPVDAAAHEAYSLMFQQAEVVDARELGRALEELGQLEMEYYATQGWFGACDSNCTVARDKVGMARTHVSSLEEKRDKMLSEARHEVGIWSSFGVQDVRDCFWRAWKAGKDFAARMTMYDVMFATVGRREESLAALVIKLFLQYVVNLTIGLIGAFFAFVYNVYCLIVSYGSSFLSGLGFFLLASVAGISVLATYLGSLYAGTVAGGILIVKQAAAQKAIEAGHRAGKDGKQLGDRPRAARCPV